MKVDKHTIKDISFLILCLVLSLVGLLVLADDVYFFLTKQEAIAQITQIETKSSQQSTSKVILKYYNKYENKFVETYVDDIKIKYIEKIKNDKTEALKIYYYARAPKKIYIQQIKYPRFGYLLIEGIFSFIFIGGAYLTYANLKNERQGKPEQIISPE